MNIELICPTHRPLKRPRVVNVSPPYNLAVVAANTPPEHKVSITDAYVQRINYRKNVDLVGITSLTASIAGAIDIARKWKARGVPVVMGGIHPTGLPDEILPYCDAVVVGEAEGAWQRLLRDFEAGRLQRVYQNETPPSLDNMPLPRRDLLNPRRYLCFNLVETSRGCPFSCEYCSNASVYGDRYRFRPVEAVVEEIRRLPWPRFVVFLDNNIVGHPKRAKELFRALIPLRIKWTAQASITMAYDDELIDLAARAGCLGVLVGLETLKPDVLKRIGKPVDPNKYVEYVDRIQRRGIFVQGEFIFGFDEDTPGVIKETMDFVHRARLASARFAILKPYPGTRLYFRWLKEGRLRGSDWSRYHSRHVVYEPKNMTQEELGTGREWSYHTLASVKSIWHRVGFRRKHWPLLWLMNMANAFFRNSRSS